MGFVFQDFNLLDTFSIEDNIYLPLVLAGKNPSQMERRLVPIAGQLGITGILRKYPYEVSGGQKQRLSIARAICRHPEILIFDDSFSALDYKTDRVLRDTLRKTCADATRFIVAQRIGTIRDADKIIVLDDGKIAGMGKHNELMETCEVYRQIAYSQLSKEELA